MLKPFYTTLSSARREGNSASVLFSTIRRSFPEVPTVSLVTPWLLYHVCMPKLGRRRGTTTYMGGVEKTGLFQPGRRNDCGIGDHTHGQHPTLFLSLQVSLFPMFAFCFQHSKPSLLPFAIQMLSIPEEHGDVRMRV